jgi:hypothetical protein
MLSSVNTADAQVTRSMTYNPNSVVSAGAITKSIRILKETFDHDVSEERNFCRFRPVLANAELV